jgi:hypothetical protein
MSQQPVTDWGNVSIKSFRATNERDDEQLWLEVELGNVYLSGFKGPMRSVPVIDARDHWFHRRLMDHLRQAGIRSGGAGGFILHFACERSALEETVTRIRAAIAGWNELYPTLVTEYEAYATERAAEDAAMQKRLEADQAVIDRLMSS